MRYPPPMRFGFGFAFALLVSPVSIGCSSTTNPEPDAFVGADTGIDGGSSADGGGADAGSTVDGGSEDDTGVMIDAGGGGDGGPGDDTGVDAGATDGGGGDAGPCVASGSCNPFDPTSCGSGMACRPGAAGAHCVALTSTTHALGEACSATADCEAGLVCLTFGAEGPLCHQMCHARSVGECTAGYLCTGTFGDTCIDVCRPMPAPCDIYAQDCPTATDTCTLVRNGETNMPYTGCRPAGTQTRGMPCGGASGSCGHGLICVSTAGIASCSEVCDPAVTPVTCTTPDACTGLAVTWGVHYCEAP